MMKRIFYSFFFLAVFFFSLCACLPNKNITGVEPYFSLTDYFDSQVQILFSQKYQLAKSMIVDGNADEKNYKITDWHRELRAFFDADINDPSCVGKYKGDTISADSGNQKMKKYIYTPLQNDLPVQKIVVTLNAAHDSVTEILVQTETKNWYDKTITTLDYLPLQKFDIFSTETELLFGTRIYEVKGDINLGSPYFE
jgi:hypothetical protein